MATDSLDRLIRQMERWLEEDKRERQRYRQRKKNGTLTESEKRIEEFLARGRRETLFRSFTTAYVSKRMRVKH